jgi:hypothetical protein
MKCFRKKATLTASDIDERNGNITDLEGLRNKREQTMIS